MSVKTILHVEDNEFNRKIVRDLLARTTYRLVEAADQVYAVTAYLLHLNGIIGEQDVLDARTLPLVKMPNRAGFVPDARPDVGKAAKTRKP